MNKKSIITILFFLAALTGYAQTIMQNWFKTDTITIKGRIEGYDAEKFGFTTMQCYYEDVFEKEQATLVLDISPDGTFEKSFVISYPSMNRFYTGNSKVDFNEIPFFVRPGETIEISVRLNEQGKYECIYNNGSSKEVERWLKSRKMMSGQCRALSSFKGKFSDVQAVADNVWHNLMQCVSSVSQQFHYTPFEVQMAQAEAQVQFLSAMINCADNHDLHSYKEEDGITMPEIADSAEWLAIRDGRNYAALRHIDFDNPLLLSCEAFPRTLNRTEYSPMIHTHLFAPIKNEKGEYERPEFLSTNKKVLENVCQSLCDMFNTDNRNCLMIQLCNYKHMQGLFPSWIQIEETKTDTTLQESFRHKLSTNYASPENMFSIYLATFSQPFIRQKADKFYTSRMMQEGLTSTLPLDNPVAEIIRRISTRYPGRILFVDFWAMWCGNCKYAINKSKQLRAEMAKRNDVKLIFIANEENPENDAYKRYVNEWLADEEIICVNNVDFRRLQELFHFSSIPHYEVFTPDCRRVHDDLISQGYYSLELLLKRLKEKLK